MAVIPRCPYCNAQGLEHLATHHTENFTVVYCGQCGAIYGVLAVPQGNPDSISSTQESEPEPSPVKPAPAATDPRPRPPAGLLALAGSTDISLAPISPDDARQRLKMVSLFRERQRTVNVVGETGFCPTCNREMVKMAIPEGYKNSGQIIYYCPNYEQCGQWYFVFSDV